MPTKKILPGSDILDYESGNESGDDYYKPEADDFDFPHVPDVGLHDGYSSEDEDGNVIFEKGDMMNSDIPIKNIDNDIRDIRDIRDILSSFNKRIYLLEEKLKGKSFGGKTSKKTKRSKKSRKSKRGRKTRKMRNTMKNRGKGKELKMTPITDKKELQRLEEYDKRAAEREKNDNKIKRINSELDRQKNNLISGWIGTPMDAKEIQRQKEEDESHNRRVNSKKAKSRKLTVYDL